MKKLNFFVFCMALSLSLFGQQKPIPRDTTYTTLITYNKIKKNYPEAVPAPDKLPKGVKEDRDVVYTTLPDTPFGSRDLHVDVFQPKKKGKYPALIMVHGGGWRSGDKSMQIPMAQKLAAKGFVTVCVEYQLSLEAKFPAAVHNIKAAIRWMRANAEKYNIDPDKIAISGCSAGGQLAALVGMTNGVEKMEGDHGHPEFSSEIQAVVDIDGVIDFMAPLSLNLDRRPDSPDVEWLGGTFYEVPGTWKDASSIFWANENSAPILFLNSGYPRFHAGQDEMIGMFKIWDIYTEVHKFDVQVHPFWLFDPWVNPTVDYIAVFLTKSLTK